MQVGWPITPGFEFSGTVVEVGSDVHDIKVGDNVFGATLFGAYSARVRTFRPLVWKLPDDTPVRHPEGTFNRLVTSCDEKCKSSFHIDTLLMFQ